MKPGNVKKIKNTLHSLPLALLFCFIPLILGGCKAYNSSKAAPFEITGPYKNQIIGPDSSFEECIELSRRQVVEYAFKTSRPVDFNIHYHGEDKIHYPVLKNNISAWKGNFKPDQELSINKEQEYFCLMWENHNTGQVELTLTYEVTGN